MENFHLVKGADSIHLFHLKISCGGVDKFHVIYGGENYEFKILKDANPKRLRY